jgi:hypothetical protein
MPLAGYDSCLRFLFTITHSSDGYPALFWRTSFEINDDIIRATGQLTPIVAAIGIIGSVSFYLISGNKRRNRYHGAVREMDSRGAINNH